MSNIPNKQYYFIEEAANRINYSIHDLIHYGVTGRLKIAADINFRGNKYSAYPPDTTDITVFYDGLYYIDGKDLKAFEYNRELSTIKVYTFYPVEEIKRKFDKIANRNHDYKNDKPLIFVEVDREITVYLEKLIIFHDDLMQLERVEHSQLESADGNPLTSKPKQCNDLINPKRETSLLTIIGALLEVISGNIREDILKHPSIKNQTDLITKLSDLEIKGLSTRNLEKVFAQAKTYIDNA